MPWKNQGGGPWGSGPKGPWGSGPQSVGPRPPDLEDLLRRGQDRFRRVLPGGFNTGTGIAVVLIAIVEGARAPRRLDGIEVRTPEIVRLWTDRQGAFERCVDGAAEPGQPDAIRTD